MLSPVIVTLTLLGKHFMGSPIFKQSRVGLAGKTFQLYKFRSLPVATADMPTHQLDGSQIPAFGSFLRRTKLDELPQLWCVLKGDMSLVGPRPCLPIQSELVAARAKRGVFDIKPGITGLAQIRKVDMSTPVKLARFDAIMNRNYSVCLYLFILVRTSMGSGTGDRVKS